MANGPIIKLQPNIPVTMTVKYVDFRPGVQYGDQISVKGDVDNTQGCMVYLPISKEGTLQTLGVIGPRGADGKSYPLLMSSPKIKMLKTMDGTRQPINIELVGSNGASAPQAASPSQATTAGGADKKSRWESLVLTMEHCISDARKLWGDGAEQEAVAATAHTLFIQSVKDGVLRTPRGAATPTTVTTMVTAAQKGTIASLCLTLGADNDRLSSELTSVDAKTVDELTEAMATKFIGHLNSLVAAMPKEEEVPF